MRWRWDSEFAAGFGGWWLSADAEEKEDDLAHALAGDTELLAGVGEGESLDGAEAKDLSVALPRHADRPLRGGRQHQVVLVELADDVVEGFCSDLGVPEQLTAVVVEQIVHVADAGVAQAGVSGWAEAQLENVHSGAA